MLALVVEADKLIDRGTLDVLLQLLQGAFAAEAVFALKLNSAQLSFRNWLVGRYKLC